MLTDPQTFLSAHRFMAAGQESKPGTGATNEQSVERGGSALLQTEETRTIRAKNEIND